MENIKFMECESCRSKSGTPTLCESCLHNRSVIEHLKNEISKGRDEAASGPRSGYAVDGMKGKGRPLAERRGMKTKLSQIFCRHIWKDDQKELAGIRRREYTNDGIPHYSNFEDYIITQICVKCEKTRKREKSIMII